MRLVLLLLSLTVLQSCAPKPSVYYWKTTLAWSDADTAALRSAAVERLGLRLLDWGPRGAMGPLTVSSKVPAAIDVVPVAYVTTDRLDAWARGPLDAAVEARALLAAMDQVLPRAWAGTARTWQLDADWTARTRDAWFAVARAFGALVHERGARFEVTIRLHQFRDRAAQGVPPADGGVLMLYGVGDAVLDPALVSGYVKQDDYPIPLTAAFPNYTQVRQLNGYGRLVGVFRVEEGALPTADLRPLDGGRYEVLRRAEWNGSPLLEHDVLAVDTVDDGVRRRVAAQPAVASMLARAGAVWWFDYTGAPVPRL